MSGPKIDDLSIEELRAQRLAAERDRNSKLLHRALTEARACISKAKSVCVELEDHRQEYLDNLEQTESTVIPQLTQMATCGYPTDPDAARQFNNTLAARITHTLNELEARMSSLEKRAEIAIDGQRELRSLNDFDAQLASDKGEVYECFSTCQVDALLRRERKKLEANSAFMESAYFHALGRARDCLKDIQTLVLSPAIGVSRQANLTAAAKTIQKALSLPASEALVAIDEALEVVHPLLSDARGWCKSMESLYTDCLIEQARIKEMTGITADVSSLWEFTSEEQLESQLAELRMLREKL